MKNSLFMLLSLMLFVLLLFFLTKPDRAANNENAFASTNNDEWNVIED